MHCGLALLTPSASRAGLFILLNAEFLLAVQIIVYAGAILVLYLFVLMLLNLKTEERYLHAKYAFFCSPLSAICGERAVRCFAVALRRREGRRSAAAVVKDGASLCGRHQDVQRLFAPFEIVGVFLFGAIIGAIVLAKTPTAVDVEHGGS